MIRFDILTQKRYESNLKLKPKENDMQLTPNLICDVTRTTVIRVSNLSYFRVDLVQFSLV
jgi:hypothetical protein